MSESGSPGEEPAGASSQAEPAQEGSQGDGLGATSALAPRQLISGAFGTVEGRRRIGFDESEDVPQPVVFELNSGYTGGPQAVRSAFEREISSRFGARAQLAHIADLLYRCTLSVTDVAQFASDDMNKPTSEQLIYHVWPDFPVRPLTEASVSTIGGIAARRAFGADGAGVTWAVVDSGINAQHAHFQIHDNLQGVAASLHRDFTPAGANGSGKPLTDTYGHGTHVAGIIAGELPIDVWPEVKPQVAQRIIDPVTGSIQLQIVPTDSFGSLTGAAPKCKLVSLKVLDDYGIGDTSTIIRALRYVDDVNSQTRGGLLIHGVNLSLGYEFDAHWFACGQSPICVEVNRLVRTGVIVVVAAGNTGYGQLAAEARLTSASLTLTINDPGNAELAITVGSTHRDEPLTYGVSYFSSKGPTGDGRAKPDVVAPGEKIFSCASGQNLRTLAGSPSERASYVDDDGTSMATPHVSGAVAALLSVKSEYMGHPDLIKQVLTQTTTSLGREDSFQGSGLVNVMRALSSL